MIRQFVKMAPDGRCSVITTNGAVPVVDPADTLIETTDAPVPRGVDVSVVDGAVVTSPRAAETGWTILEEPA